MIASTSAQTKVAGFPTTTRLFPNPDDNNTLPRNHQPTTGNDANKDMESSVDKKLSDLYDDHYDDERTELQRSWRPAPVALSAGERAEAEEAYLMFDLEGTGKLRLRPTKMAFRALGVNMTKWQVAELMAEVADQEPEGWVSAAQFVEMFPLVIGMRDIRKEICKAFDLFDHEQTGSISFANMKRVAMEAGEELTDADIHEIIDGVDKDGDGVIRRAAFEAAMGRSGGDPIDDLDSD